MVRLMKQFSSFREYAETQPTYDDIIRMIHITSKKITEEIEAEFVSKVSVRRKKEFVIPEYPKHWIEYFSECEDKIQWALDFVNQQIRENNVRVFPSNENIFGAFICRPEKVRVIIIGQDPYPHDAAMGMAFSSTAKKVPASLKNIYNELKRTHGEFPSSADLTPWAKQGVLLINTCLTVNENAPESHGNCWVPVVVSILNKLFEQRNNYIVCLWGAKARNFFQKQITYKKKFVTILEAGHPSPVNRTNPFVGCGHFQEIDRILEEKGMRPINWIF